MRRRADSEAALRMGPAGRTAAACVVPIDQTVSAIEQTPDVNDCFHRRPFLLSLELQNQQPQS